MTSKRRPPQLGTKSTRPAELSVSFLPQELQFLVQALRDLPMQGTPDSLAQALPLIQGLRLKLATALRLSINSESQEQPSAEAPAEAPAE